LQEKREFYRRSDVSAAYDEQRFGGLSGARVNEREISTVLDLLPAEGNILDLACGTGRLTRALKAAGRSVVGLDASPAMAELAAATGAPTVIGDGFQTPFQTGGFQTVASIRFAFHCPNLEPLLAEMQRLARPGGSLVFDTYSWSPRAAWAIGSAKWGSRVYVHSRAEVAAQATRLGLHIDRVEPCFLFSPYLYRLAPLPLERAFEALERRVPASWLCRVFWKLTRVA
jgi:SAM-dependent methyltransferase